MNWSSRPPQLFPQSNSGHHGPQSSHADSTRRPRAITNWSSRPPQLFLPSNSGHHGPHNSHADSSEPSSYKRAPPAYPAALSERTNQDGHALLRHSPVFPRHRRQYYLNPLDINKQSCTRIDKLIVGRGIIPAAGPGRTFPILE
jgi:hypothetical protein